jgi:universal stress protein E
VICDYEPYLDIGTALTPAAATAARGGLRTSHEKTLEALAAPLKRQKLSVQFDVRWDYPLHEAIIRQAVEWGADLIVKDTHHHSALRRSIFSNTDWNLIRQSPLPLLLVKPRPTAHVPCVVAAVDPLHPRDKEATLDNQIVTSAQELARLSAGQVHLLHVCETLPLVLANPEAMMAPIAIAMPEIAAEMEKNHTEAVHALAETHGIPAERVHVRKGNTRQALVEATDELRTDFLVMGAVSRSALERLFIGSTAEGVLDKLGCDVFIVKPGGMK